MPREAASIGEETFQISTKGIISSSVAAEEGVFARKRGELQRDYFVRLPPGLYIGVSPTKVRKVPQDSCQQSVRKGFAAISELPRWDLV